MDRRNKVEEDVVALGVGQMELEVECIELRQSKHSSSIREKSAAFMTSSYKTFRDAGGDDELAYKRARKVAAKNMPFSVLPVARRVKVVNRNIPSLVLPVAGTSRAESIGESLLRKAFTSSAGPNGSVVHVIEEDYDMWPLSLTVQYSCQNRPLSVQYTCLISKPTN
jgi:hypothetical protein